MSDRKYGEIYRHYENTLTKHGPNHKGMDWPDEEGLKRRFEVMLELTGGMGLRTDEASLLDLGCGVGLLYKYIQDHTGYNNLSYSGMDISELMISHACDLYPEVSFETRDILKSPLAPAQYDFIVMNGVLTEKVNLTQEEMLGFAQAIISSAFQACKQGLAFNVMSHHVDWTREDLFHWPIDEAVSFLVKHCSRHIKVLMHYGLYEYTIYVYKEPLKL